MFSRKLDDVDWSLLPAPVDDGGAAHLVGLVLPSVDLPASDGTTVDLASTAGRVLVYSYPRMGSPDEPVPADWDAIPGARGCTPQSCAFRDHFQQLRSLGVARVFGLSTQDLAFQRAAVERLQLPFPLLSDDAMHFARAVRLPTFEWRGRTLLKRLALVLDDGVVTQLFYPVFPPDRNAGDVIAWLKR